MSLDGVFVEQLQHADVAVMKNEPLKKHTSFQIGGPADYLCRAESVDQLQLILKTAGKHHIPWYVLGNGSNVLFRDEGFRGVIIKLGGEFGQVLLGDTKTIAGAGVSLETLCLEAQQAGLAGLAFAYGIPGSVGGAVYMNAGAYGGEIKDVLLSVRCLDEAFNVQTIEKKRLELGYRSSVFQSRNWIILDASFALHPDDSDEILSEMQGYMQARRDKQPLEYPSAGSAFKRPRGNYAGALIDECGLRGYRVGGAAISEKHCGFIVNLGRATCADVMQVANDVSRIVHEKTGYTLEKEMRVVEPWLQDKG